MASRNWQNIFLKGQGFSPDAVTQMTALEVDVASALALSGFSGSTTQSLKAWAQSEAYQPSGTITRDASEVVTTCAVLWPDGSTGTYTTTATSVSGAVDAYTITHTNSGLTVTQAAVTRDAAGAVTTQPALTVT